MLNNDDIKKMDEQAVERKLSELRLDLFKMKMQKTTSGIEKPHLMKVAKKNIARLLTVKTSRASGKQGK
jgi:large subunit ribosomal protein L29